MGLLNRNLAALAARSFAARRAPLTAADAASLLGVLTQRWQVGGAPVPEFAVRDVVDRQLLDGGWPPSNGLLVPSQQATTANRADLGVTSFADDERLFTTSLSAVALTQWATC